MAGTGIQHTPFYIPDWHDPMDIASTAASHVGYGYAARGAAYAYGGSWAPSHAGIFYEALFSPRVVRGGSSALSETMFAMRVYSTPFRAVARFLGPVGLAVWLGYELYQAPPATYTTQEAKRQQRVYDVRAADIEKYG